MKKFRERKKYLRNGNGNNYEILATRRSRTWKGHNDYIVRSKNGGITIANGWNPKDKSWVQGSFYGWDKSALYAARRDFRRNK